MLIGILLGLSAAFFQSLSYLFSGHFVRTFRGNMAELLVLAHVTMGGFSLLLLPTALPETMPAVGVYAGPLLGGVLMYVAGQLGLFMALRCTDASRVSPLLGLKLPILTMISIVFLQRHYSAVQWLAVGICLLAAFLLNRSGGRISGIGLTWILAACLGYCLSDLNIRLLVERLRGTGLTLFQASLLGACLSYLLCGALAVAFLPVVSWRRPAYWRVAVPFALAWYGGMLSLFACFGAIGVVFGNIVQSTRGLLSVILGALVARAGYAHLETSISRSVLLRRLAAAVLMILAIVLFSLA